MTLYNDGELKILVESQNKKLSENVINQVNDGWFSNGEGDHTPFNTHKKPSEEKYEIAKDDGVTQTLEGPVKHKMGHYIMTGPKGEKYPITPEKFKELKIDKGNGIATPKPIQKIAKLADHDGVIHTSWGDLNYKKGQHYIVKHGPNDYGAVERDIFHTTYQT